MDFGVSRIEGGRDRCGAKVPWTDSDFEAEGVVRYLSPHSYIEPTGYCGPARREPDYVLLRVSPCQWLTPKTRETPTLRDTLA